MLTSLPPKLDFALRTGWIDQYSRPITNGLDANTCYETTPGFDKTTIYISFEALEPILDSRTTNAEKALSHFNLVAGIVHEITVSCPAIFHCVKFVLI